MSGPTFDLIQHLHRQREFSERTFGPGARTEGVIDHIRKELREIEAAPDDLSEWIDVALLALDGAWRSGASPEAIAAALLMKQTRNEARTWPDWRTADPTKAIEHDRSGEVPAPLREPERGAVILKGVGKIDGDGWKDTTCKGDVVFVWNAKKQSPYAPGQYPRIGNEGWSASASQYDFSPATVQEIRDLFAVLATREEAPAEAGEWIKRAMRFIDLCDADAGDYQDQGLHRDAALLTRDGFALFGMGDTASIADLEEAPFARHVGPDALRVTVEALKHYRCSCPTGACAMSADDTDTPVDDQLCGRRAARALEALEGPAA